MKTLKYFNWEHNLKICDTCVYCNEYAYNVYNNLDYVPHGYDGSANCDAYDSSQAESIDNRMFISPMWKACQKYKKCSEAQALWEEIYDEETKTVIKNPHPPIKYAWT